MSDIQRWTCADGDDGPEMWRDDEGDYVIYSDHKQALDELKGIISGLKDVVEGRVRPFKDIKKDLENSDGTE